MQLGLWLELRPADDLVRTLDRVAALGFGSIHAHFPEGCDSALARRVRRAGDGSGLTVAAVSGYANPLRPDLAPMGYTPQQLPGLIDLLPALDCRCLVSWSGTYAAAIGDGHPDNQSAAAWDGLRRHVDEVLPLLDVIEGVFVLEPFFNHVLSTADRAVALCREVSSPYLRLVLDAPNLLPPDTWGRQAERIADDVSALASHIGFVHLKDMRLRDGALDMPAAGQGVLDYGALLGAIAGADLSAPMIVEHVTLDQAAAARQYVLSRGRRVL